jgi:hypothetical protein
MSRRIFAIMHGCACLLLSVLSLGIVSPALAQRPKDPLWTHAFDLSCRKYGENEFTDKTRKFGVEVFKDLNTGYGLYVSQIGSFAAAPGFDGVPGAIKDSKPPQWVVGLDLPSRKAGDKEFTKDTRVYSLEVFRDANIGNWIYVTEKGNIAVVPAAKYGTTSAGNIKAPKWLHSFDLGSRKGGVPPWKDAHKFGFEIYRDNNTGNLIYICDTGAIAVLPDSGAAAPATGEGKSPVWLHGFDLKCRKHNEPNFGKKTQKFGVEVFRDENNGNLIYLCESGALAVVPGRKGLPAPSPKVQDANFTHALNLSCRTVGEKEFSDKTRAYGAEVFRDENTGVTLYIAETGSISAVPVK